MSAIENSNECQRIVWSVPNPEMACALSPEGRLVLAGRMSLTTGRRYVL
jgi:hypothetical protein